MPNVIDRLRGRLTDAFLGDEKRRLNETARLLSEAYLTGPFLLPPQQLIQQLRETDSAILQDLVNQLYYENLTGYGLTQDDSERQRAVSESRRLWKYSPLAWWSVWLWTNYGLGESLTITCDDEAADKEWQEFWKADRNATLLATDKIADLSNKLLVTGERFLLFFASVEDGEATIRKVTPEEITEIITHPDDKSVPLFYKRKWVDSKGNQQTLYYPDWQAYFDESLDKDFREGKTLAKYALPDGAARADEQDEHTTVVCLHISHNGKDEDDLRGWPILSASAPYVRAHQQHLQNHLAVSAAKAMYVREFQHNAGSRATDSIKTKLNSRLSTTDYLDANPPAVAGSSLITNKAVEHKDLPVNTGAGDAKMDNEMFAWMALLGMGLFPTSAGLDTSRWATALAMDKTQSMQWSRYQTFWSVQFRIVVKIVLKFKEKYGSSKYQTYNATISTDQFSLVDFPGVVSALSQMVSQSLTPLVDNGTIPQEAARSILARLWQIALQALGVSDAADLTTDEVFGVAPKTSAEVNAALAAARLNFTEGHITTEQLVEFLLAELMEQVKPSA